MPDFRKQPVDHSNGHIFRTVEGDIFYSPNSSRLVDVPPLSERMRYPFSVREAKLDHFLQPRWWTEAFGFLAFVNRRPSFDDMSFSCIRDIVPHVGETMDGNKYSLFPYKVKEWLQLQDIMIVTTHTLRNAFSWHVLPAMNAIPPSFLGFEKEFHSLRAARLRAAASRDWFVVWISLLSFTIADISTIQTDADWFGLLASRGISQSWLSSIASSPVCDFSTQCARVGTFLDVLQPTRTQPPVQWFCHFNVDVWYLWTLEHEKLAAHDPVLKHLRPPEHMWQAALTFITSSPSSQPSSTLVTVHFGDAYHPQSPAQGLSSEELSTCKAKSAVSAYIATKPWTMFFAARAERNAQTLSKETPDARNQRLQREKNPATASAEVYLWELGEGKTIELIRRRVLSKGRVDVLRSHPSSQCIYDSISNTWDVCEYFGPDDEDYGSDDSGSQDGDAGFDDDYCHSAVGDHNVAAAEDEAAEHQKFIEKRVLEGITTAQTELHSLCDRGTVPEVDLTPPDNELDIHSYLSHFYGFVPPLPIPKTDPTPINRHDWDECLKSVGLRAGDQNAPIPGLSGAIIEFIRGLQGRGPHESQWDLLSHNHIAVKASAIHSIFRKIREDLFLLDASGLDASKPTPWCIAVKKPVHVIYIWRILFQEQMSAASLAMHLAEQGIPFHTLMLLGPSFSSISLDAITTKIPRRLANYKFLPADYHAYVAQRARFFSSSPRTRAALLEGGMTGRLAREHLGIEDAALGPSTAVTIHRLGYSIDCSSGATYWDDKLTPEEIAVICGLHHCYTGNGNQIGLFSWWPLPSCWDHASNGRNWCRWTEWDEVWYQTRLSAILQGDKKSGVPLSQSDWRQSLKKGSSVWKKVTKCISHPTDFPVLEAKFLGLREIYILPKYGLFDDTSTSVSYGNRL
ncbi:hypothetical protein GALMADRAFT_147735 [Galerina marginata CBS 339.88]|uniref:Uncharacterized protein n=1 Tax=Galerina marginata (strain CBS 339.88) TaxID=685588 RepID=A0A067SIT7_GALM3|nr:hypothetical protein GALMADRAFT_147735 [Galerina marginata CBS 339.88]